MVEEGYSQCAIDSLWKHKPADMHPESEKAVRQTAQEMKNLHSEWATREDDELVDYEPKEN